MFKNPKYEVLPLACELCIELVSGEIVGVNFHKCAGIQYNGERCKLRINQ